MKALGILLAVLLCSLARAQSVPTDIKLTNGFVMRDCTVLIWGKDTITVKFVGGTVPVRYANISAEQRPIIEKCKEDMKREQTANQLRSTTVTPDTGEADSATQNAERRAKEEEKAEKISHGVMWHELVLGMNFDQARQAIGGPTSTSTTHGETNYDYWTYAGRGKGADAFGYIKDLHLSFKDGILTSWSEW